MVIVMDEQAVLDVLGRDGTGSDRGVVSAGDGARGGTAGNSVVVEQEVAEWTH